MTRGGSGRSTITFSTRPETLARGTRIGSDDGAPPAPQGQHSMVQNHQAVAPLRVHLRSLGCRLNEAELQTWARQFEQQGHQLAEAATDADLVVLNTCAVTLEAVRKSRQIMRRVHRANPQARLVVTGCYATLESGAAAAEHGVDLVVANQEKSRLVEIATRELGLPGMPALATEPGASTLLTLGRGRAFVKIQDGCRYRCTFCIVTVARGAEHSRPVAEVVSEVNALHAQGVREAVLTGVHVGGYGSDIGGSLSELVRALLSDTDMPRIRFASVEPWDLGEEFLDLFQDSRLMPHMHLPLQSGSDTVLKRMARRCKTEAYARLVERLRECVPGFNVTTDIIVGFPGETESEWTDTLEFVERVGFGHLHVFSYSPRAGTKAAGLPDPVSRSLQQHRSRELHRLGKRMKGQALADRVGRCEPILWEHGTRNGDSWSHAGYTPAYFRVLLPPRADPGLAGQIGRARLTGLSAAGDALVAELIT